MRHVVLAGAVATAVMVAPVFAQDGGYKGRTAPFEQPNTAPSPTVPAGDLTLGSVRLPKAVMADGKKLAAGTYQVRITSQVASPDAKGQTAALERWVEFVQGGQVKGREVATVIPQSDIKTVEKDTPPGGNSSKFETLAGGDYARLWINRGGNHDLVHFPTA